MRSSSIELSRSELRTSSDTGLLPPPRNIMIISVLYVHFYFLRLIIPVKVRPELMPRRRAEKYDCGLHRVQPIGP